MTSRTGSRRNSLSKGKEMTARILHEFLLTTTEKRLFRASEEFHRADFGDCEPSSAPEFDHEIVTSDILLQWNLNLSKQWSNTGNGGPSLARPTETHIRRRLGNQTRVQQQRQMSPVAGSGPGGGRARPIRRPGSPGGVMQPSVRKKKALPPGQGTMKRVHRLARPTASSRQKADAGRTKSKMIRSRSGRAARPSSKAAMHHHTQSGDVAGVLVGGRSGPTPRRSRSRPADFGASGGATRLSGHGPTQLMMSRNMSSPVPASADETESVTSSTAGADWDGEEGPFSDWDDDPDAVELHLDTEAFGDLNDEEDDDEDEEDAAGGAVDDEAAPEASAVCDGAVEAAAEDSGDPGHDFPPSADSVLSSDPGEIPRVQV